jgi:Na+:H+ antiporter
MAMPTVFAMLGGLLVLAYVANRLFRQTRIPDVIVLMAAGVLLGPVFHIIDRQLFEPISHLFGTLALVLILFEAGLELDIRDTIRHFPAGLLLSVFTYALSVLFVVLILTKGFHNGIGEALLYGAVLGCTSGSITLPVLQQIEASVAAKTTLLLDASLSDTLAVLTVGVLLNLQVSSERLASNFAITFLYQMAFSLALAAAAAALWSLVLPKLSEQRFWQVLTFSSVLLLYASAELIHANGLITVLGFGLGLSNFRKVGRQLLGQYPLAGAPGQEPHLQILNFHSEISFLVRSFFFVLIGVLVHVQGLTRYIPLVAGILGAIILARWLAARATGWLWLGGHALERELPVWIFPRGLITVVLALEVLQTRGAAFAPLAEISFAVILATNLILIGGAFRAAHIAALSAHPEPKPAPLPSPAQPAEG